MQAFFCFYVFNYLLTQLWGLFVCLLVVVWWWWVPDAETYSYCFGQERKSTLRAFLITTVLSPSASLLPSAYSCPKALGMKLGGPLPMFPLVQYQSFATFLKKSVPRPQHKANGGSCVSASGDGMYQSQRYSTLCILGQRVTPAKKAIILFHGKLSHTPVLWP